MAAYPSASASTIAFGPFYLDPLNQILRRGPDTVHLTPKSFTVLKYLVLNAERLVTKEELLDVVWERRWVSDANLKVCIREIRKALGDEARAPRFIATRHRRGYCFMQETREVAATTGVATGASASAVSELSPFVERDVAMALLQNRFADACLGKRQLVFISGEFGIGKTTLIDHFVDQVGEATLTIRGQCIEQHGTGEPYLPLTTALSDCLAMDDNGELSAALTLHAPSWAVQLPVAGASARPHAVEGSLVVAAVDCRLRELAQALESLATRRPVVLVVEDLHWSDAKTLDVVNFLARRDGPARVLVIGTYRRADALDLSSPLLSIVQELAVRERCHVMPLQPLSARAVQSYLVARFPADRSVDEVAALIHQRTEGNPLFIVNLIEYLLVQHRSSAATGPAWQACLTGELPIPGDLRQMIELQLGRLSIDDRLILEVASIVGQVFSSLELVRCVDLRLPDVERACARLAQRGQFVRRVGVMRYPSGLSSDRFEFLHAYYREVLYQEIGAARRETMHGEVGRQLEAIYTCGTPVEAARLAQHFEQARLSEPALDYLCFAADQALLQFANREAIAYLHRALALFEREEHGVSRSSAQRRLTVREKLGLAHRAQGYDIAGAIREFTLLAAEAQQLGRIDIQARGLVQVATILSWFDLDRCLVVAEQATSIAEAGADDLIQAHAQGCSGYWRSLYRQWNGRDAAATRRALVVARRNGDKHLMALHGSQAACIHFLQSRYGRGSQAALRAMVDAQQVGDGFAYMMASFYRIMCMLHAGEWGPMADKLSEARRSAQRNGNAHWQILLGLTTALLHLSACDYYTAVEICEASTQESEALDYTLGHILGRILSGHAYLGLGRYSLAVELFRPVIEQARDSRMWLDWPLRIPADQGLAESMLAMGNLSQARIAAERASVTAAQPGQMTYLTFADGARVRIALRGGDLDEAEALLELAMQRIARCHAPLAAWRLYALAGHVAARRGRRDESRRCWARSAGLVQAIAASLATADAPLARHFLGAPEVRRVLRKAGA